MIFILTFEFAFVSRIDSSKVSILIYIIYNIILCTKWNKVIKIIYFDYLMKF